MRFRPFDSFLILLLLIVVGWIGTVLFTSGGDRKGGEGSAVERRMARKIAYQAKVDFLQSLYQPVRVLADAGNRQGALLKLKEIGREYPGEPYGNILRAAILNDQGAKGEAIAALVDALQADAAFLDEDHPLSMRVLAQKLVRYGEEELIPRSRQERGNPTLAAQAKQVFYLQSRLAGGCE